jgi:outer membrane protein assembly factor BamB
LNGWFSRLRAAFVLFTLVGVAAGCSSVVTGDSWANLSTDGKLIYVAYKDQVFAVDPTPTPALPADRRVVTWLKKLPNNPLFYAAPSPSADGGLYLSSFSRQLHALRADNGNVLEGWRVPSFPDKVIAPPLVTAEMIYVGMGDKGLRAYNRANGQETFFSDTKYGVWGKPLLVNDTLYVPSLDHFVYALNPQTLALKWKIDVGGGLADTPSTDGAATLFLGTWNNEVVAVDVSGDQPRVTQRFKTTGWVWATPQYDNGTLYFGDLGGTVYAIDAKTFEKKWAIPPEADVQGSRGIRGRVGVAKNITVLKPVNGQIQQEAVPTLIVYASETKRAYAVDEKGQRQWVSALTMSDRILSDVLIVGGSAVFTTLSEDQLVVAINLSSGQKDWQLRLADAQPVFKPTSAP